MQPNSNAATLNQVSGPNPSQILGRISANGSVFITNGNGIFFGEQATVDAGGLVASTMNLTVNDFMKGKLTFKGENGDGKIGNKGTLSASRDGFIALLAPEVRNSGLILAKKGTVALAPERQSNCNSIPTKTRRNPGPTCEMEKSGRK